MAVTTHNYPAGVYNTNLHGVDVYAYKQHAFAVVVVDGVAKFLGSPAAAADVVAYYNNGCPDE